MAAWLDRAESRLRAAFASARRGRRAGPRVRPRPPRPSTGSAARAAKWVRGGAIAYLALTLAAVAVVWGLGDQHWIGTVTLFGPRWLVLLPLAALVPAALALDRRALIPLAAGATLALGPVMGLRVGWQGWVAGGGESLRVISFNADGETAAVARLRDLMEREGTAFAAVQECARQAEALLEHDRRWRIVRSGSLCLVSRYPAEALEHFRPEGFDGVRAAGIGGTTEAARFRVALPGGPVEIVNVHLETPRKGLEGFLLESDVDGVEWNRVAREIESRATYEWTTRGAAPGLIVLGDLNMPVESRIYRDSWAGLDNAFSRAGWGFGATKDNGWFAVRIDHVLSAGMWRARRARVGPDLGSDHWPLIVELRRRASL